MSDCNFTHAGFQAGTVMAACMVEIERRKKVYSANREKTIQGWLQFNANKRKTLLGRFFHKSLTREKAERDYDENWWFPSGPNIHRLQAIQRLAENTDFDEVMLSLEDAEEVFKHKVAGLE